MGALSYTLAGTDALKLIAELNPTEPATTSCCCAGSRRSCSPGCKAPLPDLSDVTRELDAVGRLENLTRRDSCGSLGWSSRTSRARVSSGRGIAWAATRRVRSSAVMDDSTPAAGSALALTLVVVLLAILAARAVAAPQRSSATALLAAFRKVMPPMSQTEREALEAGTVWWDGELFSGRPDWRKLLALPAPALTADEQRFLDEEVEDALRDGRPTGRRRTSTRTCRRTCGSSSRTRASSG